MREAGTVQLTSLVSVSVDQACGSTPFNLQVSRSDAIIAQFIPPWSWPAKSAFFLLCKALHRRNYAQVRIMRSCRAACADSPVDMLDPDAVSRSNCT